MTKRREHIDKVLVITVMKIDQSVGKLPFITLLNVIGSDKTLVVQWILQPFYIELLEIKCYLQKSKVSVESHLFLFWAPV